MSVIICTASTIDYTPELDHWVSEIGDILITVAQKHLEKTQEDMTEWLTFAQVAQLCRSYHHTLPFRNYRLKEMGAEILELFNGRDSINRHGVKIRYQSHEEHPLYLRVPKTVHCLKFFRIPTL